MPSDERTRLALAALAGRRNPFRAAMTAARDEISEYLAVHQQLGGERSETAMRALGPFAAGRIDAARFGAILTDSRALTPEAGALATQCAALLSELIARGDELFVREVPSGADVGVALREALSEIGRAFGAARLFRAVKGGSYRAEAHEPLLGGLLFERWNRAERELMPPLVVELDGADLRAEIVADYLDGRSWIVFVVRGAASPAPLVRLVSPDTLVIQAGDLGAITPFVDFDGPAVAALVPAESARFVHDPRHGARLEGRLTISHLPPEPPKQGLGRRTARQLAQELAQLAALRDVVKAARDVSVVVVPPVEGSGSPLDGARAVDAVAAWMLAQAGFTEGAT